MRSGLKALVLGGSGAVGAEVVRGLTAAGVDTVLTFHSGAERARALAAETGARAVAVDLRSRAIVWLALHNRYMSGKVLAVNGGI